MAEPDEIGLADAIDALQNELALAHARSASHDVQFPIGTVTVALAFTVTKSADGKAGISVPVFGELGIEGSYDRARTQTITLVLGSPVDASGQAIKVAQTTHQRLEN
jgi:hypothetical protein